MFFYLSKLIWLLIAPVNLLLLFILAGVLLGFTRFARSGRVLALLAMAGLLFAGFGPASTMLARPLEDRFPRPANLDGITGIIVLGGAIGLNRGEVTFNAAASRMTTSAELALRLPQTRLAFTGGSAGLLGQGGPTEADAARAFYLSLGIAAERLILEDRARNTVENARFLKPLLAQKPGERWLLITSAWHMPRSVGVFRQAGIAVVPYPVDFVSSGTTRDLFGVNRDLSRALQETDQMAKEWVGLLGYWLAGHTDALLPSP
ncbi:MAG: YdcF family protein [Beijerinckiaceae bacterium]|jgi:uncharacterized SAM-binding protein YcdF (DUF218 family)|nr:YdcF family protein [Beijerinckiaceae bacterium]